MEASSDLAYMSQALSLAERGLFSTRPNPRVGCLIVRGKEIVGRGWHEYAGGDHAEVMALKEAGNQAEGAVAYVTLEPCNHHGRTPPCTEALIAAKVARVVVAIADPDPRTAGEGIERLKASGIEVVVGACEHQAFELNIGFLHRHQTGRPYIRLKLAASIDGRATAPNGESQWITSEASRADVHWWRARACAIVTGIGTVLSDNPRLNARLPETATHQKQPIRVVMDSQGRIPRHAKILESEGTVWVLSAVSAPEWVSEVAHLEWHQLATDEAGGLDINEVIELFSQHELNEVHIEAGPTLSGAWLGGGHVDEVLLYQAAAFLGAGKSMADLPTLHTLAEALTFDRIATDAFDNDLRMRLRARHAKKPSGQ